MRALAQRSAAAAKEIKTLITDSVARVESGGKLVAEAGRTMDEVMQAVNRAAAIVSEISSASKEQAAGIDQVRTAIVQVDQITEQNGALVEEAAAATETMHEQLAMLGSATAVFNVRDEPGVAQTGGTEGRRIVIDATAREFLDSAVEAHTKWKTRLLGMMRGSRERLDPRPVGRDDGCELGKWLHPVEDHLHDQPLFERLKGEHATFHKCAAEVIDAIQRGDAATARSMLDGNGEFSKQSTRVVQAIRNVRAMH